MLATRCLVLRKALAVWHPHPRAAASIESHLLNPVPRSHKKEKHNFSGLQGNWRSMQGLAALGALVLPSNCTLYSPYSP